jgi:hypothetical protein
MRCFLITLLVVAGTARAADRSTQAPGPIRFEDTTAEAGIRFVHSFGSARLGSLLESTGAGCVWFDYDNDGRMDLYVVTGKPLGPDMHPYPLKKMPQEPVHNHLYRNEGGGKFTDVTDKAGVGTDMFSFAVSAADYDNDGYTDLLVSGYGKAILYRNKGDGTFEDVSAKTGISVPGWAISSAWLDYDRDGCVDLVVGRYVKFDPKYRAYYAADNYPGPLDYEGDSNLLFRNNCNGTFTDVSVKSGLAEFKGRAMGVTAADYDGDGYPDIYVANDKTENYLFRNKRNGTFEEIALPAGVAYGQNGENTSAMGPVFFDFDRDGRYDLWVSDSKYNRLLQNTGEKGFVDVTETAGISQLTAQYVSWGSGVHDFDNDGLTDILITHGGLIHMVPQEHSVFRNLGGGKFADVAAGAGSFFETKTVGRGSCSADYDNDGKIDYFLVNLGGPAYLLHNVSPETNHWLSVRLVGKKSNRDGIGAALELLAGGQRQFSQRVAGSSYLSQDDPRTHFGLGTAASVERLTIRWPSGIVQNLQDVPVDRILTVEEK